jgi:hypothetical protein
MTPARANGTVGSAPRTETSVSVAKDAFLAWADESDARKLRARSSVGAIAVRGALAVLGGVVIARVISARPRGACQSPLVKGVGTRLLSWALVARAAQWLIPLAVRAATRGADVHGVK